LLCHYTSFAEVVNGIFSDGSEKKDKRNDLAQAPSFESAIANINSALNFG
jgi:hypothetical protein